MRKKIIILSILLIITGCSGIIKSNKDTENEQFFIGNTLNNGRVIHFSFEVPYKNSTLSEALSKSEITIEDFIKELEYVDSLKDGGSKLYKYSDSEIFGDEEFYTIVCDSLDNVKDIFVAKHINSLTDKCSISINDLADVEMTIKEGTLTNTSATIVITDKSKRKNIYGEEYKIQKKENEKWEDLDIIFEGNYGWTAIGYTVNENKKLELKIN